MQKHIHHRKQYDTGLLTEELAGTDPIRLFARWLEQAESAGVPEPHAMTLATNGALGPSARIVLLRTVDPRGFTFYTNYNSRKAMDLEHDARAALLFFWPQIERQVRVEGVIAKVEAEESDAYFASRPRESRIGAWASDQSRPVESRDALDDRYVRWKDRFGADDVPRPAHWGGYRVHPTRIEFWQGRPDRLHDRLLFLFHAQERTWERVRLQP
ncbi:MAG: pyridoxamine 5'-phosphate oxidase [Flavobacteriales bacterium]|nr:pyridoxamine 5'-phosphate oxidase [Flavobacteriales bacterium]